MGLDGYLTLREAAARYGYTPDGLRRIINNGRLEAVGVGQPPHKVWMVTPAAVERYIASKARGKRGRAARTPPAEENAA